MSGEEEAKFYDSENENEEIEIPADEIVGVSSNASKIFKKL